MSLLCHNNKFKIWMKNFKKQCYTKLVKVETGQKLKMKRGIHHGYKNDGTI